MDETTTRILEAIELLEENPRWNNKKLGDKTKMLWVGWVHKMFDSVDDFEKAVEISVFGDNFFPSMKELREKIVGDKESEATLEWAKILKLSNSTAHHLLPFVDISFLSERTKAALASVGGLPKVASINSDKLDFLEKQFAQSHSAFGQAQVKQMNVISPQAVSKQIEGV